ncbi:MAG TPA: tetratricopeptide repeat protein, partial [Pirellulales bacterium]
MSHASAAPTRRAPNLRLLLISAVAAGLIGCAGHFWHAFQLRRNAAALLRRVERSLELGEQTVAMTRLRQYLKLRPDDADQQVRLAQLVDRTAQTRRQKEEALQLYTLAIGFAPQNADLLRRRAELSYELQRFAEAIRQVDDLLRKDPDDAGAVRVKALALAAQARLAGETPGDRLAELFERALKHSPGDVELALELARIYRAQMPLAREGDRLHRGEKASLADRVMTRLIEASPRSPEAYLARYQYREAYGLAGADDDLRQALAFDSQGKHLSVLIAAGLKQLAKGAAEQATAFFNRAIAAGVNNERGYLGLGRAHEAAGDRRAAQAA